MKVENVLLKGKNNADVKKKTENRKMFCFIIVILI